MFLSGVFMRVTFRTNVLPTSSRVSKRLDPITSVTERAILERKTQLVRCIRFSHPRASEHFERPLQQRDNFTRVVAANGPHILRAFQMHSTVPVARH